jgi:hypothetical protein
MDFKWIVLRDLDRLLKILYNKVLKENYYDLLRYELYDQVEKKL